MTNEELTAAAIAMRRRAQEVGSMSALWDVIFDAEHHAAGEPGKAFMDREAIEDVIRRSEYGPAQSPGEGK